MAKKIDLNGLDHFKEKENAMIASEYSSSQTYAVGDYVYHNGTLYKCTTAITTAEAWASGHWTAAKLADDCSELKSAFTQEILPSVGVTQNYNPLISNYSLFINTSNVWSLNSQRPRTSGIVAIPNGTKRIKVISNATHTSGFAFLTSDAHVANTTPDYATGWQNVEYIAANTEKVYKVPSDATHFYYAKTFTNTDNIVNVYTPQFIGFISLFDADNVNNYIPPLGLHEMPPSLSALNIVKRCRQMTDIKWTPAVDLKRFILVQRGGGIPETAETQNYLGTFKAGTEYTGIPYGRVSQTMVDYDIDYATVGHYIDFETFISSVFNQDSKICKENVGSVSSHTSVIYATVCSGLACYALNVDERATASIPSISGLTLIGKVNDEGVLLSDDNFKIGDILNKYDYHVAIITDIIRNTDGEIVTIELSDASTAGPADRNYANGQIGGMCRRKGWTREQLFNADNWGGYSLYRYTRNVPYTPSPYVNVGDEFDGWRIEHFPCMPYEGNKFTYKTGYIPNNAVKILVSLGGYAYLKVFKDGTEISGSPFAVTDETASIDVSEISTGVYTAYLCNITDGNVVNLTYPCEWTISE